jgi:signal transduction histidine kinase
MNSVRRRLLIGTAAATIAIFCAAGVTLYLLSRAFLVAEFDATLRARIQSLASMTEFDVAENRLDADDTALMPEYQPGPNAEYFEIQTDDGRHAVRSASLGGQRIDRAPLAVRPAPAAAYVVLPDGRAGRAITIRARTQPDDRLPGAAGPEIAFTVAKATAALDRPLARLRLLLATVCGVATAALLVLTGLVIRRAMRPVERLALDIGAMRATDLAARLRLDGVPEELAPVVSRLNELLGRLESAFERERCFTSDAAHELRTPLAGLAAALEVCANERRDPPQYERVVRECLGVVRQMHAMIENLLTLARADAGRIVVNRAPVKLGRLLREAWAFHQSRAAERRLRVEIDVPDDVTVEADDAKLSIIFNNLLANAVQYADDGGRVCARARASGALLSVSVTNTGSRVGAEDAPRVFDRFWRGDAARGANGRNCGLGMAVCRKLADALGATITVTTSRGGTFAVELSLPRPARRAAQEPACV